MSILHTCFRVASNQFRNHLNLKAFVGRNISTMRLPEVIDVLKDFAPLQYAEPWDNVGLLVEPSTKQEIERILLTNDLTENVLEEALMNRSNLIVVYHPPIFAGIKRLTMNDWKQRIILKCIENHIAVYSPHTSWDACPNGVTDWLAASLPVLSQKIALPNPINSNFGGGRVCMLKVEMTLDDAVRRIKAYTGMPDVRVGIAVNKTIESPIGSFAVCAGSGGSVLKEIKDPIDLFITGELSHHDALDAIHRQIHVVTLNHSNSERGYLKLFKKILQDRLHTTTKEIEISVSKVDVDPLSTY
ncbi:CLUMA_CG001155, isoform A [Clunio marinus]|uniref:NIF3-like protein 1 n=1 Tax=Clunio marinus TaxID=568069 RepID=A0A1J1HM99_9DIPT|nr:CLUMA_CG001155, isoform A [Clunio marinus]